MESLRQLDGVANYFVFTGPLALGRYRIVHDRSIAVKVLSRRGFDYRFHGCRQFDYAGADGGASINEWRSVSQTTIWIHRENGGFMKDRIRFVVNTTI